MTLTAALLAAGYCHRPPTPAELQRFGTPRRTRPYSRAILDGSGDVVAVLDVKGAWAWLEDRRWSP